MPIDLGDGRRFFCRVIELANIDRPAMFRLLTLFIHAYLIILRLNEVRNEPAVASPRHDHYSNLKCTSNGKELPIGVQGKLLDLEVQVGCVQSLTDGSNNALDVKGGRCSTLYDLRVLRPSLRSVRDVTLSSFPTATTRSASFRIIVCRRPEGVGSSCFPPAPTYLGRVVVDSSSSELKEGSVTPASLFGKENIGWSLRRSFQSSSASMSSSRLKWSAPVF